MGTAGPGREGGSDAAQKKTSAPHTVAGTCVSLPPPPPSQNGAFSGLHLQSPFPQEAFPESTKTLLSEYLRLSSTTCRIVDDMPIQPPADQQLERKPPLGSKGAPGAREALGGAQTLFLPFLSFFFFNFLAVLFFNSLAACRSLWALSSPARGGNCVPCSGSVEP